MLVCVSLCWFVLVRVGLCWFVLVCGRYCVGELVSAAWVLVCVGLCWFVMVCARYCAGELVSPSWVEVFGPWPGLYSSVLWQGSKIIHKEDKIQQPVSSF